MFVAAGSITVSVIVCGFMFCVILRDTETVLMKLLLDANFIKFSMEEFFGLVFYF
jgi:hypothetical protein